MTKLDPAERLTRLSPEHEKRLEVSLMITQTPPIPNVSQLAEVMPQLYNLEVETEREKPLKIDLKLDQIETV